MIDLYFAPTGNGQRARILLEESGLAYRLHRVDLAAKTPEFLGLNPVGQIPVIVDSAGPGRKPVTITQSAAIAIYIANKVGKFWPRSDTGRIAALEWMMMACTDAAPSSGLIFMAMNRVPEKSDANTAFFETRMLNYLRHFDTRLDGRDYLAGTLSVADFALYPVYTARRGLIEKAGGLTRLDAWAARLAARPAVQRAMQPA
jgi:GST-like protein